MTDYSTELPDQWWREHDNIVALAYWMQERDHGVDNFVTLIEKPWKFTDEYEEMVADREAEEAEAQVEIDTEEVAEAIDHQAKLEQEFHAGFDEARAPEGFIQPTHPPRAENQRPT